MGISIHY